MAIRAQETGSKSLHSSCTGQVPAASPSPVQVYLYPFLVHCHLPCEDRVTLNSAGTY